MSKVRTSTQGWLLCSTHVPWHQWSLSHKQMESLIFLLHRAGRERKREGDKKQKQYEHKFIKFILELLEI